MNLSTDQKQTHWHREQTCGCQGGGGGSGMNEEFGVSRCKLLNLEGISNEVLLYSTGIYIQLLVMEHDGRWYKNIYICVCVCVCIYIKLGPLDVSRNWQNTVNKLQEKTPKKWTYMTSWTCVDVLTCWDFGGFGIGWIYFARAINMNHWKPERRI